MRSGTQRDTYDPVAKIFHWLIAGLLAAQYAVGGLMPHIGKNTPNEGLVTWHLSIGAGILLVIVLRFLWRLAFPVALHTNLEPWERQLSRLTHALLYVLVIVMTVLGWAAADYQGWDIRIFGLVSLPAIAPKGAPWAHTAGDVHDILVWILLGVIALHVAGALYHYFIKRDQVLQRMLAAERPPAT